MLYPSGWASCLLKKNIKQLKNKSLISGIRYLYILIVLDYCLACFENNDFAAGDIGGAGYVNPAQTSRMD